MLTGQETQIRFTLKSKVLENNEVLVVFADDVHLLIVVFVRWVLLLFVVVIFIARRQWEAWIALVQITNALELFPEILLPSIVLQVLNQLVDYAAETPEIWREVVLFLNKRYLRRPIPAGPDMQWHIALHGLPFLAVGDERVGHVHALLLLIVLLLFVRVLPQVQWVFECLLVQLLIDRSFLLDPVAARIGQRPW